MQCFGLRIPHLLSQRKRTPTSRHTHIVLASESITAVSECEAVLSLLTLGRARPATVHITLNLGPRSIVTSPIVRVFLQNESLRLYIAGAFNPHLKESKNRFGLLERSFLFKNRRKLGEFLGSLHAIDNESERDSNLNRRGLGGMVFSLNMRGGAREGSDLRVDEIPFADLHLIQRNRNGGASDDSFTTPFNTMDP